MIRGIRFGSVVAIALFCVALLPGQTESGQISGTVTDPTGAVIPGAKIVATGSATGAERTTNTSAAGVYTIPSLTPGAYTVTAEAPGFSKAQANTTLAVGARIGLDFRMEVGQSETVVQVAESVGQIDTQTQTIQQVISTRQILELPSLTRNPYALVFSAGNVSENDPATGRGVQAAINGMRASSTGILLDGTQNTDDFGASVGVQPPIESVQEFSIMQSNYTAEYGRAAGGIVNVITKSGTNDFHGSLWEFSRVSRLAANDFESNASGVAKPVFTRNQFGYSAGGPIVRNKLFFFNSTEWTRVRSQARSTAWVPTPQLVAAAAPATRDFFSTYGQLRSDLTVLETLTKAQFSAITPLCTTSGPCAALSDNLPVFSSVNYTHPADAGGGSPQNRHSFLVRGDYNLSGKTQLYGRWARERTNTLAGYQIYHSPYAGYDAGRDQPGDSAMASLVRTFSPAVVSQTKLLFSRISDNQPFGEQPPSPTLFFRSSTTTVRGNLMALPGYLPGNPGVGLGAGGPQNTASIYQDLNLIRGGHQFKFGGHVLYMQQNHTFAAFNNSSNELGTSLATGMDNLLNGVTRRFRAAVDPQGKFPCVSLANPTPDCVVTLPVAAPSFSRSNRYREFSLYGQDSWKVARGFTLNLGLRWEYLGVQRANRPDLESNFYDAENQPNIYLAIRNGAVFTTPNSPIKSLWRPDYNNLAPRIGMAWDVTGDGKTSIRGGYGISYDRNFGNVTFNVIQNPPGQAVLDLIAGVDIPSIAISTSNAGPLAGNVGSKALPGASLRNVDSNMATAYAHQWGAALERQLAPSIIAALEYSGSKGVGLYTIEDVNRPGYGNAFLGDPCDPAAGTCISRLRPTQYTGINRRGDKGFSRYHGANFRVDMKNWRGLLMRANYTWSHAIDNLSSTFSENDNGFVLGLLDPFHPELDRGDADYDVRHRIAFSAVWEVPFARDTRGVLRKVAHGWEFAPIFTARTGNAYTIYDSTNIVGSYRRAFFSGPVPRSPSGDPVENGPNSFAWQDIPASVITQWVNPLTGTSDVGPFPASMVGRNAFRGPGNWNIDLGIYKNFDVTERVRLQFRGEMYNAVNHSNLYVTGGDADLAGEALSIVAKRGVPPSYLGGNDRRNVQLALRVIF